ncbi:ferric reductase-like transmembrane domain-containing protein [Candidatus Daviesbacteria bacterium]|nr:ferric reductase-like transmembrane domain-containing protein [Candidatus Daviesbacteria bacterium]MBI4038577.1 ferric reductase-like transmembrane domain-containing protein [Candidatus Daviesbacteria bacterium]
MKNRSKSHPYHYFEEKNLIQRLIDIGVPLGMFFFYFQFYNFGQFTPKEMVKTTGLLAVALLSLTLLIGPACRFFSALDVLKAHRKFWGVLSFFIALIHGILVYIFYANYNLAKLFNPASPKYYGLLAGLASLAILLTVTLTSNQKALNALNPKTWKMIQSTAFIALIFAVLHFYLVESVNGVLVIKRVVGQITFGFASFVIVFRILTSLFPRNR